MPTITQLEYLVAVDKERHFGRAAEKCNVSQPSLSNLIHKLEEELDFIIFDRSKKPIIPTDIGKEIIQQAKLVLREHKKLNYIASNSGKQIKGDFNLAVIPTLASYLIPLFIGQFAREYPEVNIRVSEHKTDELIDLLVNDELDAGLLVTPLGDQRIIERHLFFEPFYLYVAKDHPVTKKKFISEQDLEDGSQLWLLEEGHCFRNQVLNICSLDGKKKVLANLEFASGNFETLKNLIKKGSGYTLLPELAVNELSELETDSFVRKFKKPVPTREVSLIHSRSFLKESIIHAMEQTIVSCLPPKIRSLKRSNIEIVNVF